MDALLPDGVDELDEDGAIVHLAFHVRGGWYDASDDARRACAWKAERCAEFLRSPAFRERFGKKPGVIVMKSAGEPPPDVRDQMVRLGIDVEVGTVAPSSARSARATAVCAFCGKGGFLVPEMAMTDSGLACPACFQKWEARQEHALARRSDAGLSPVASTRILFAVGGILVTIILRACLH